MATLTHQESATAEQLVVTDGARKTFLTIIVAGVVLLIVGILAQVRATLGNLAGAEDDVAAALAEAEDLGDPAHGRVGVAVAVSADVYISKAAAAAAAQSRGIATDASHIGDGAGILFAEGLYRNALRMLGTPRPDIAPVPHLAKVAAVAQTRYAAVLRASGPKRNAEARMWDTAARRWWLDDAGTLVAAARLGKTPPDVVYDLQLMTPLR